MTRGPAPKPAELRARLNKKTTAATLTAPEAPEIPELPAVSTEPWHDETLKWWHDVWTSPMSTQYLVADVRGLVRVAMLVEDFWRATSARTRKELMAEIRHHEARFGLSPQDRDRLQWTVARPSPAPVATPPEKRPDRIADPRAVLMAVK